MYCQTQNISVPFNIKNTQYYIVVFCDKAVKNLSYCHPLSHPKWLPAAPLNRAVPLNYENESYDSHPGRFIHWYVKMHHHDSKCL
jgi:hypothetical protein